MSYQALNNGCHDVCVLIYNSFCRMEAHIVSQYVLFCIGKVSCRSGLLSVTVFLFCGEKMEANCKSCVVQSLALLRDGMVSGKVRGRVVESDAVVHVNQEFRQQPTQLYNVCVKNYVYFVNCIILTRL